MNRVPHLVNGSFDPMELLVPKTECFVEGCVAAITAKCGLNSWGLKLYRCKLNVAVFLMNPRTNLLCRNLQ